MSHARCEDIAERLQPGGVQGGRLSRRSERGPASAGPAGLLRRGVGRRRRHQRLRHGHRQARCPDGRARRCAGQHGRVLPGDRTGRARPATGAGRPRLRPADPENPTLVRRALTPCRPRASAPCWPRSSPHPGRSRSRTSCRRRRCRARPRNASSPNSLTWPSSRVENDLIAHRTRWPALQPVIDDAGRQATGILRARIDSVRHYAETSHCRRAELLGLLR